MFGPYHTTLDFSSMNGNGITRTCSRCNCCACSSRCDSCACGGCRGCSARVCGRCDSGTCHRRSGCSRRFCSRCHSCRSRPPAAGATAVPEGGTVVAPAGGATAGGPVQPTQRCGCSWCERTSCAAAPCQVFSGRRLPEPDRGTARRGTSLSFQVGCGWGWRWPWLWLSQLVGGAGGGGVAGVVVGWQAGGFPGGCRAWFRWCGGPGHWVGLAGGFRGRGPWRVGGGNTWWGCGCVGLVACG